MQIIVCISCFFIVFFRILTDKAERCKIEKREEKGGAPMDAELLKETDEGFMREAIALAKLAMDMDEVPIGAIIVRDGRVIATAFNTRERDK
jgi:deoxycytidylate deaminase